MTDHLPEWPRPHVRAGGSDAHLFYKVHGDFSGGLNVSRSYHRCGGLPNGLSLQLYASADHPDVAAFGFDPQFGLEKTGADVTAAVSNAAGCAVLRGVVDTPDSLNYLRDAVGLVQALLDAGGVAVFDPYILRWWTAAEWTERAFEPAGPVPRHHCVILVSGEEDGTRWVHTRGMLKFGAPDLSIHGVTPDLLDEVVELCNRFIEAQAFGMVVPDGQRIRMPGLPEWTCRTVGDLNDPDFNNRHIEIGPWT